MASTDLASAGLTDSDFETHKIFAGGLNRATTAEDLKSYFSKYGEVVHSEIVGDKVTGKSRGFGFVTFSNEDAIRAVLSKTHKLDNVVVDVKLAVRKDRAKQLLPPKDEYSRIFVGGVSENITEEYFKEYFSRYGHITSYNYIVDKDTNRPRGFGFVIYEKSEDCDKAIGPHISLGRNCEAKRAQPKPSKGQNMEGFDYNQYLYAQANMMYNPYFAQMFGGQFPFPYDPSTMPFPFMPNMNPEAQGSKEGETTEESEETQGFNPYFNPYENMGAYPNPYAMYGQMSQYGQAGRNADDSSNKNSKRSPSRRSSRDRGRSRESKRSRRRSRDSHRDRRERSRRSRSRSSHRHGSKHKRHGSR
ncbi:conserved hypothetical protein [Theileria equi strain WA]|uniref:RRM domain-containing protein n=1 Tax=Theileria equi strain WA TaxID=1537102 RepID=L1LEZ7_THEEQ|nr:conserved hypothetical protein [Theileria equi strain WA]EKX74017.1 conserved hypothetical protein [Theileria equi strain WA]|eukprot:XP_004833469.1 conserved hypothetical protein [Theileria equi strain WA]